jgi:hypothetical protein
VSAALGTGALVFPCTLDDKVISDAAIATNISGGHGATVTFDPTALNPGFTIAADPSSPFVATSEDFFALISFTIATTSGLPLIKDVSASLLGAGVTGTGDLSVTILTPGGDLVLDETMTSGMMFFDPVASIDELISISLSGGGDGSAFFEGITVNFSELPAPVPEPSSVALLALGFLCLVRARWGAWHRQRARKPDPDAAGQTLDRRVSGARRWRADRRCCLAER